MNFMKAKPDYEWLENPGSIKPDQRKAIKEAARAAWERGVFDDNNRDRIYREYVMPVAQRYPAVPLTVIEWFAASYTWLPPYK